MGEKRTTAPAKKDGKGDGLVGVRIPVGLRKRAKVYAAGENLALQKVLEEMIEEGLKKRGA